MRGTTMVDCIVVYVDPPSGDDVLTITTSCNASSTASRSWLDALDALLASANFGGSEPRISAPPPAPSSNHLPLVPTPAAAWQRDSSVPLPPPMIPMPGMRQRR